MLKLRAAPMCAGLQQGVAMQRTLLQRTELPTSAVAPGGGITGLIRRHATLSYFLLAFGLSWGAVYAVIAGGPIPAPPAEAERLFVLVYLAMLIGPPVAGIAMTAIVSGTPGLRDFRSRLLAWRVAPRWYAAALLTAPLVLLATLMLLAQFSSGFFPGILSDSADPAGPIRTGSRAAFVLMGVLIGVGAGFFEELGWTGFALPRIRERHQVLAAGLMVGIPWGAWHLLAVYWGSADAFGDIPIPLFMLVSLFSFLPPYRVLMARVYDRTGSLLIAVLMHASLTSSMLILGPIGVTGGAAVTYNFVFAAALWLVVAGTRKL